MEIDWLKHHPRWADEPRALGDCDPQAFKEVVALERALEETYNTDFQTDAEAPLNKHFVQPPDVSYLDMFSPGEYQGEEVWGFFNWMHLGGPTFTWGRVEFKELKVWAKGEAGFVAMKQYYQCAQTDGNHVHMVLRETHGVVKINGEWKVAHSHTSFPCNPKDKIADMYATAVPLPWEREEHHPDLVEATS